ncbi:unnamed protein product [Dibothriocephalus latus]|uniref:Fibronectin type-III domain-containing protein n=1 Tax=Dibothriocephalus latus TaxID=60516 RepID=A0A3P7KZS8_DIBLA|nr:unnamed protein product [Dibothriocephalus latus]
MGFCSQSFTILLRLALLFWACSSHPIHCYSLTTDVPPPPVDLECFSRGPTYAILRWLPGKPLQDRASRTYVPITSYTLTLTEVEPTSGPPMKRQITDISPWKINNDGSVHLKVIDLKPDRRYAANVYAVSLKFGMSDASNTATFSTSELRKYLTC